MAVYLENYAQNCRKVYTSMHNCHKSPLEAKVKPSREPVLFLRSSSALVQEGSPIVIPRGSSTLEEVILGAVIGKTCKKVGVDEALNYVGGYCVGVELTAVNHWKSVVSRGVPWTRLKGLDTSCAVSKLISKSDILDPNNVEIFATVNGKLYQRGNTNLSYFSIAEIISYISKYHTLHPNDVVFGGTVPSPGFIQPGDVIKGGIKGGITFEFFSKEAL